MDLLVYLGMVKLKVVFPEMCGGNFAEFRGSRL